MTDLFFHGTSKWATIRREGFQLEAPRRSDPGDFGWGIYLTKDAARARSYGEVICVVLDTGRLARIANPYFIKGLEPQKPQTPLEELYYSIAFANGEMQTIHSADRAQAAKNIRTQMMAAGYTGIMSKYGGSETVIFEPRIIIDAFDAFGNSLE